MKTPIIALVASALVVSNAQAAKSDRDRDEEGIGIGAGAIAGAIAGGPVGLIIGAATGGWAGNKFSKEREGRQAAEARAEETAALAESLQALVASSENELDEMSLVLNRQEAAWRDALRQAFEVEVYFHTGEAALDEAVAGRIERLGEILRDFDDFAVVVEGHADSRGDETYNEQLSAERAASVRDALIRSGLPGDKITTRAAGEVQSKAEEGDIDAMALERRVNLSIVYPPPRENRVARQ